MLPPALDVDKTYIIMFDEDNEMQAKCKFRCNTFCIHITKKSLWCFYINMNNNSFVNYVVTLYY